MGGKTFFLEAIVISGIPLKTPNIRFNNIIFKTGPEYVDNYEFFTPREFKDNISLFQKYIEMFHSLKTRLY